MDSIQGIVRWKMTKTYLSMMTKSWEILKTCSSLLNLRSERLALTIGPQKLEMIRIWALNNWEKLLRPKLSTKISCNRCLTYEVRNFKVKVAMRINWVNSNWIPSVIKATGMRLCLWRTRTSKGAISQLPWKRYCEITGLETSIVKMKKSSGQQHLTLISSIWLRTLKRSHVVLKTSNWQKSRLLTVWEKSPVKKSLPLILQQKYSRNAFKSS